MEFYHQHQSKDQQGGHLYMILITDGVGEENLGMVTVFCCHNHNKMEASDALAALWQCNSPQPSVVVIRRHTNTPYIFYPNISSLSSGTSPSSPLWTAYTSDGYSNTQTEVLLHHEEGMARFRVYPHTREVLWKGSKEGYHLSDPVLLSIPLSACLPLLEEVTQTGEELGYNPALQQLQDFHQARTQLECEPGEAAQKLARKYNNCQAKLVRKHEKKWAKMTKEDNTALQEVFAMASLV